MAVKPDGSSITIGGNTLIVADVKKSFVTEPFDRLEFSGERLRNAPNNRRTNSFKINLTRKYSRPDYNYRCFL